MDKEKRTYRTKIHTYRTVAKCANSLFICLVIMALAIIMVISGASKNSTFAAICAMIIFVGGLCIFGLTIGLIDAWADAKDDERNLILEKLEEISNKLEV